MLLLETSPHLPYRAGEELWFESADPKDLHWRGWERGGGCTPVGSEVPGPPVDKL